MTAALVPHFGDPAARAGHVEYADWLDSAR